MENFLKQIGKEYGFDFNPTNSELNKFNSELVDINEKIRDSFNLIS